MVVAYAEAFSWIFLLAVLLLRYGEKVRQIKASGSGTDFLDNENNIGYQCDGGNDNAF